MCNAKTVRAFRPFGLISISYRYGGSGEPVFQGRILVLTDSPQLELLCRSGIELFHQCRQAVSELLVRQGRRIVAAHGGGYLPGYIGRSDYAWRVRPEAHGCSEPPSSYLRRIWFDSLVHDAAGLRTLVAAVGADRVVLGSDFPFDMGVDDPVALVRDSGLGAPAERAVLSGNVMALIPALDRTATR